MFEERTGILSVIRPLARKQHSGRRWRRPLHGPSRTGLSRVLPRIEQGDASPSAGKFKRENFHLEWPRSFKGVGRSHETIAQRFDAGYANHQGTESRKGRKKLRLRTLSVVPAGTDGFRHLCPSAEA